jgi:sphingoid base N-palmitoyltransferase
MELDGPWHRGPRESNMVFPRDILIVGSISVVLVLIKNMVISPLKRFLVERLGVDTVSDRTKEAKFGVSLWRSVFYTTMAIYGYLTIMSEPWVGSYRGFSETWESRPYPLHIRVYYYIEFSYYFVEIFYLFSEHYFKDFSVFLIHHMATLGLIALSYNNDFLRYGVAIMALHDISDPFLEIGKLVIYTKKTPYSALLFVIFTTVFFSSRLVVYPCFIVRPAFYFITDLAPNCQNYAILVMLSSLVVLHIIWAMIILRIGWGLVATCNLKDTRSMGAK